MESEKPEKLLRDSVLYAQTILPTIGPRLFGSHFGVSPKIPCHLLATVNGHARDEYSVYGGFFSITTKPFIINIQMHKMKAFVLISYSFIDVRTVIIAII